MSYIVKFENDDFLIISKAVGIEFHGETGILSRLREEFPELHGVHRLDRETSGLMIFAKTKLIQSVLSKSFELKQVQKKYLAISDKKPTKKQGLVKGDLEKSRGGSYKLARTMLNPSVTRFYSFFNELNGMRGFILVPFTGKTHQLRVVMKSLGSTILGDKRYKGLDSDRLYLHSYHLNFEFKGKDYVFEDFPNTGCHFAEMKDQFLEIFSSEKL